MTLAENLVTLSKQKGLSISALAKLSGVKQPTLHGWTAGRSVKNIDELKKVCAILGVGLHTILYGEKDPFEDGSSNFMEFFMSDLRITIERMQKDSDTIGQQKSQLKERK